MQPGLIHRTALPPPVVTAALCSTSRCTLPGSDAQLYLIEFEPALFEPGMFAAATVACPVSVARSVHKRQAEFLFGRLAARMALLPLGWPRCVEVGIGHARQPLWPEGVIGSITHAGRYAGAIAMQQGHRQGVGIDIEGVVQGDMREALLSTVLDASEAAMMQAACCDDWSHDALITALFSAKESLFKAAFGDVGRYFGFQAARCSRWDRTSQRLHLVLTETLSGQFAQGRICEIGVWRLDRNTVLTCFLC